MSQLADQLADLTALRDRDALDTALVSTLQELLQLNDIAIYRLVGPLQNEHWLPCARLQHGVQVQESCQTEIDLDALPRNLDHPERQRALDLRQPVMASEAGKSVFPLASRNAAQGVLELGGGHPLSKESCQLVSAVLRLYQNFQALLDYGERDALTELLNRKTFDGAFLKATTGQVATLAQDAETTGRRHRPPGGSYWLAMLDIDHFKRVNDNFGHLIGDEVLLLLARLMRSTFRFHDQLYRFGGEEFVVLMHCTQNGQAQSAFERLRRNTEQHTFPQVNHITISVGFTEIRLGDTPAGAFERADKAVYYAKEHGRNQVCNYEQLVAQGMLTAEPVNVGDIELF